MSKENFISFYSKYVEKDISLMDNLASAKSEAEFVEVLGSKATEAGYEFKMEDIRATVIGELSFAIEKIKEGNSLTIDNKFFNPIGKKVFTLGKDVMVGTCHC